MKHLTLAFSVAALALPLCAQDRPNTTTTVLAQPQTAQEGDSPLVKAAKATKKSTAKKGIVITNENLQKTGGHLFIANPSSNPPLPKALPPANETAAQLDAAQKAKAAGDAKVKKLSAAKKEMKTKEAAADLYGESVEERVDDPAVQEHAMDQLTSTQPQTATAGQPQTVAPSKPPQQ